MSNANNLGIYKESTMLISSHYLELEVANCSLGQKELPRLVGGDFGFLKGLNMKQI